LIVEKARILKMKCFLIVLVGLVHMGPMECSNDWDWIYDYDWTGRFPKSVGICTELCETEDGVGLYPLMEKVHDVGSDYGKYCVCGENPLSGCKRKSRERGTWCYLDAEDPRFWAHCDPAKCRKI